MSHLRFGLGRPLPFIAGACFALALVATCGGSPDHRPAPDAGAPTTRADGAQGMLDAAEVPDRDGLPDALVDALAAIDALLPDALSPDVAVPAADASPPPISTPCDQVRTEVGSSGATWLSYFADAAVPGLNPQAVGSLTVALCVANGWSNPCPSGYRCSGYLPPAASCILLPNAFNTTLLLQDRVVVRCAQVPQGTPWSGSISIAWTP